MNKAQRLGSVKHREDGMGMNVHVSVSDGETETEREAPCMFA